MDDFEGWYRREHPRVFAACLALTGDREVAVDATDEAFVRACERWGRVQRMDAPGAWVQTVALNVVRRHGRRWNRQRPAEGNPPGEPPLPDPELWAAVRALPHRQREVIVLRFVGDLPELAIAAALGISRGAVSSSLSTAKASLRTALGDRELFRG